MRAVYGALILRAARLLDLPAVAGATASVYWHRFFSKESLLLHHPSVCAAASLFLASKVEECSRRVRDVINVVYRCEHSNPHAHSQAQQMQQASPPRQVPIHAAYASPMHPSSSAAYAASAAASSSAATAATAASSSSKAMSVATDGDSLQVSPLFWELKEEVVRFEQKLLRVLGFECRIKHPLTFVLHIAREMEVSEEVCRIASYMANDAARTSLCLQYAPHATACACIYLAAEIAQEQIRFHPAVIQTPAHAGNSASAANADARANASPYRSPHHSNSTSAASTSGVASAASSSSLVLTTTTSHSSEWWEYFGGVNQLEIEDIVHQLLDLFESEGTGPGGGEYDSGYTPHQELARIAEDVSRELKQQWALEQARNQRIEASLRETNSLNNHSSTNHSSGGTAMTDDDARTGNSKAPLSQQLQPRTIYSASSPATGGDAYSASTAAPGSAGKAPHRLSFPPPPVPAPAPSTPNAPRTAASAPSYPGYATSTSSSGMLPPSAYGTAGSYYTPSAPFGSVAALRNAAAAAAAAQPTTKR